MSDVFYNGTWVPRDEARVSAFDAGLQHAVGLFETMTGGIDSDGEPWIERLERHLHRLTTSASELGLVEKLRSGPLGEAALESVKRAGHARARVRLTVTGGDLNLLEQGGATQHDPTVLIVSQPATNYPKEMFERGAAVILADAKANPLDPTAGHKTLNYWWRLRELQRAARAGAAEAIVLQVSNHLAGGCVSNLFIVKNGTLFTPIARGEEQDVGGNGAIPSPVLPGITRDALIEIAEGMRLGCARKMLDVNDLLDADEVFLTNSSWGVLPVVRIEKETIGDGTVGELTRKLTQALAAD
ncbi:MAG: branched-chain amino acid aminotransferase [Phycisphaerales bacterium]|jgi:branched-chain amino acid aminotransferase